MIMEKYTFLFPTNNLFLFFIWILKRLNKLSNLSMHLINFTSLEVESRRL